MKQFTGTVKTPAPAGTAKDYPVAPDITKTQVESLNTLLSKINKPDGSPVVNYDELLKLTTLQNAENDALLSLEDRYFIYEIINMVDKLSFPDAYKFLLNEIENNKTLPINYLRRKILFDSPLLEPAKNRMELDMEIFRDTIDVTVGAVDCKKCGSSETMATEKQQRSADEPMTIKVTCLQCKHHWTAQ